MIMVKVLRGVSPVVATALLVLIAIATAVILYLWVSGTVQTTPQTSYQLQERIKIDTVDVQSNTTHYNFTVYVRNVGDVNATLSTAYLVDPQTSSIVEVNDTLNIEIKPGDVTPLVNVFKNIPADSFTGNTALVRIVTTNGIEATYMVPLK